MKKILSLVPYGLYFFAATSFLLMLCIVGYDYLHWDAVDAMLLDKSPVSFFFPPLAYLFAFVFSLYMGIKGYQAAHAKK